MSIAIATACSDADSTAAASASTSSRAQPSTVLTDVTVNRPAVGVPVLSKTTVSITRMALPANACQTARVCRTAENAV